jgi:membrane protein YdbS with pleckstrin-like domain
MMSDAIQLGEGEEIAFIVRRHWYHLAIEGAVHVFIFVVALVGTIIAIISLSGSSYALPAQKLIALSIYFLAFLGLILWMKFFAAWTDHWLDAWVVTNKRVIDIEQHGFFRRDVSSYPLDRIQDVTFNVSGLIAMWLKFGDVRVQTASITDTLMMKQVPFPGDVKEQVITAIEELRKHHSSHGRHDHTVSFHLAP